MAGSPYAPHSMPPPKTSGFAGNQVQNVHV
jgi:hypothetical protein